MALLRHDQVFAGLLIGALMIITMPAGAAQFTINPDRDAIQNAINDSATKSGDIIIMNPGIYTEHNIIVNKNLTLRANTSASGNAENTIIEGKLRGRIFYNAGNSLAIDNLTLRNGTSDEGGAIYLDHGSLSVTSSIISNCSSEGTAGAIRSYFGPVTITSTRFYGCSAKFGGAIFIVGTNLTINSSSFINCSSTENSGAIWSDGIATISSTDFTNCSTFLEGGALYSGGSPLTISNSTFTDCSANSGGAVYTGNGTDIISSSFSNCTSRGYGGAISSHSRYTTSIVSSTFSNCSAELGGAISSGGDLSVTSSTFSDCSGLWHGGAFYIFNGNVTLRFSRILNSDQGKTVYTERARSVNMINNWWGSNADPSEYVHNATVSPWLILTVTANPVTITPDKTSAIRASLTENSDGTDTSTGGIFVPDGITGTFTVTTGKGSVVYLTNTMKNGITKSIFTPKGAGPGTISAKIDNQSVSVNITATSPSAIIPGFGFYVAFIAVIIVFITRIKFR